MNNVLDDIKVLDLSQFLSGPRCTQVLADFGAEVIKVEPPAGETLRILSMLVEGADRILSILNRNKKAITLNLREERGREILKGMIPKVDVIIENFTPGTMERFGLSYKELKDINPGLIYASLSGFGQTGPNCKKPAFDIIAQATGGIMMANHQPDKPPGTFFGDMVSGAYTAIGILLAIIHRGKSGKGQFIDVSMQDVMFFHNYPAMSYSTIGEAREDMLKSIGKTRDMLLMDREKGIPFWHSYETKDGYVAVVALTDGQWRRLVDVIGMEELKDDEKFGNALVRFLNADLSRDIITRWTRERSVKEVVSALDEARVPCGPVMEIEDLPDDPQLIARGMFAEVDHPKYGHIRLPSTPIQLSETPREIKSACPDLGRHNSRIYYELMGYGEEEINELRKKGII